jgi:pimeloyl-ACP methyl ester carboxylesterase
MTSTAPGRMVSRDGTTIAYDRSGDGPPVILVDGALCSRTLGPVPRLAQLLASEFTVFHYDRRGRGDSGDTKPYGVDRELEDLDALMKEAGGPGFVFGLSSGAVLALTEAARGLPIAGFTRGERRCRSGPRGLGLRGCCPPQEQERQP